MPPYSNYVYTSWNSGVILRFFFHWVDSILMESNRRKIYEMKSKKTVVNIVQVKYIFLNSVRWFVSYIHNKEERVSNGKLSLRDIEGFLYEGGATM